MILDMTQPTQPVPISTLNLGMRYEQLALAGGRVFLCNWGLDPLRMVDVGDPYAPVDLGELESCPDPVSAAGFGDRLGVSLDSGGWRLYDCSGAGDPTLLDAVVEEDTYMHITMDDDRVAVSGSVVGVRLYGISPAGEYIELLGDFPYSYSTDYGPPFSEYWGIAVSSIFAGDRLVTVKHDYTRTTIIPYVYSFFSTFSLKLLDISDPADITEVADYELGRSFFYGVGSDPAAWPLLRMGDQVILASGFLDQALSFSTPGKTLDPSWGVPVTQFKGALYGRDDHLVLGSLEGLETFTIPDPPTDNVFQAPPPKDRYQDVTLQQFATGADFFAVDLRLYYEFNSYQHEENWILLYDPEVSLDTSVGQLLDSRYHTGLTSHFHTLYRVTDRLVFADVSDPADPGNWIIVPGLPEGRHAVVKAVDSPLLAYTVNTDLSLQLLDMTLPANPILNGTCNLDVFTSSLVWSGDWIYVIGGDYESNEFLVLVDASDPFNPVVRGSLALDGARRVLPLASGVMVYGNQDIWMVDTSDPQNLTVTSHLTSPYPVEQAFKAGEYHLYLVDEKAVHLVRLPDLADVGVLVGTLPIKTLFTSGSDQMWGMTVEGLVELPRACQEDWKPSAVFGDTPVPGVVTIAAYPNPFNPQTMVHFTLEKAGIIKLAAYDLQGRCVRVLDEGYRTEGEHNVLWDGRDDTGRQLASGLFLLKLTASQQETTGKVMMVR